MLEDEFGDVVAKARGGLGLDLGQLSAATGIPPADIERIEACALAPSDDQAIALAGALRLRSEPLLDLARGRYAPAPATAGAGPWQVRCLTLSGPGGFTSNTYLLWHEGEADALIVDPGFEPDRITQEIQVLALEPRLIAVTHGHRDHVGQAAALARRWDIPVLLGAEDLALVPSPERTPAFRMVAGGERVPLGRHELSVRAAPGHTAGGRVYAVGDSIPRRPPDEAGRGPDARPAATGVAFVGDTLFAGSIGRTFGGPMDYPVHLETVRQGILGLGPTTRLCPGHGPQTTVGQERAHNPFA